MKRKLSMAGIGALLIMLAIYFFPFGQDIVMLWLTKQVGTQVAAWTMMYVICFALLFAGAVMGGAALLGGRKLAGIFRMLTSNPLGLIAVLVAAFLVFQYVTTAGLV